MWVTCIHLPLMYTLKTLSITLNHLFTTQKVAPPLAFYSMTRRLAYKSCSGVRNKLWEFCKITYAYYFDVSTVGKDFGDIGDVPLSKYGVLKSD